MRAGVSVITHATEDGARVLANLARLLGAEEFETSTSEGHHGNPIRVSSALSPGAAPAIGGAVPPGELEEALERGRQGGRIYLRLDKQAASEGRIALSESDPVRITITAGMAECRAAMGLEAGGRTAARL